MRARRIEREQLALDLIKPRFELSSERSRGAARTEARGALPNLQALTKLRGERRRIARDRMAGEAGLDFRVLRRELVEQRSRSPRSTTGHA
jgi:hypothetical protein